MKIFSRKFARLTKNTAQKLREEAESAAHKEYLAGKKQILDEQAAQEREIGKVMDLKHQGIDKEVRVRFAPSPTGDLHIGGLRTALYNYLFAKVNDGKFILRIEDTDKNREVEGSAEKIIKNLKWAGLKYDEGPGSESHERTNVSEKYKEGPYAPYLQSKRLGIYKKFCDTLVEGGHAYYCFCTTERLKQMREEQGTGKSAKTKYDRFCHGLDEQTVRQRVESGEPYVIRMLVPKGKTEFKDLVHGKVIFDNDSIDDQVIMKSDGFPTYHFANVVDDYLMRITHVIRGEEWLPSTPKHILLYKMFEIEPPTFAHLPLLLNMQGQKLSKRHGDVSVDEYRDKGYLPSALLNGLALLGWNPPHREDANALSESPGQFLKHEVLSVAEMEQMFNIQKVGKSGVKFEEKKLEFLNSMHIRNQFTYFEDQNDLQTCLSEWRNILQQNLDKKLHSKIRAMSDFKMTKIMDMMKIRIHFYSDLENHTYFWEDPDYSSSQSQKFLNKLGQQNEVKIQILSDLCDAFDNQKPISAEEINKVCSNYLFQNKHKGFKNEDVFFLLRFAVSGNPVGAPTGDICEVIGLDQTIKRCKNAIEMLKNSQNN